MYDVRALSWRLFWIFGSRSTVHRASAPFEMTIKFIVLFLWQLFVSLVRSSDDVVDDGTQPEHKSQAHIERI